MSLKVYKIECITKLHVGSGDINYGVVDKEVEKDCVTEDPIIHASGIKGALRDKAISDDLGEENVVKIFGGNGENSKNTQKGSYKFFDAHLLCRPLRVGGNSSIASVKVTTPKIINKFIDTLDAFGYAHSYKKINVDFGEYSFLSDKEGICIEGDDKSCKAGRISGEAQKTLESLLGKNYALSKKALKSFSLPVIARNNLGKNRNLWYEEYVPEDSTFYTLIMGDDDVSYDVPAIVQLGGNSSIGYGFTKIKELGAK